MQPILKHTARQPACKKRMFPPIFSAPKLKFKTHIVIDQDRKLICRLLAECEISGYRDVACLFPILLDAQELIANKDIDTDCFGQAMHSSPKG